MAFKKNDFIGRDAAAAERDTPPARRLVTLVVDATDADAVADEPVWHGDEVVGFVTSGGYAHTVQQSVALALVPRTLGPDAALAVEILGDRRPARRIAEPAVRPDGRAHAGLECLVLEGRVYPSAHYRRWVFHPPPWPSPTRGRGISQTMQAVAPSPFVGEGWGGGCATCKRGLVRAGTHLW